MTASILSLTSILFGIFGAFSIGFLFKKYSFGLTGNTMLGVFGSIFLIKLIGRLGVDPNSILLSGSINYSLLILNYLCSFLGGAIAVFLGYKLNKWVSKKNQ